MIREQDDHAKRLSDDLLRECTEHERKAVFHSAQAAKYRNRLSMLEHGHEDPGGA